MGIRFGKKTVMKNSLPLGLALVALLAIPAWADPRTISTSGHGEIRAVPDMAEVRAGVTITAPTAAQALAANSSRMQSVFAALRKMSVPEKDIQTTNFYISPQYTNGEGNTARRLTGYQVSNDVTVRLEDIGKVGSALDALVAAGANQMNGISFSIQNPAPVLERARTEAIADARTRAETYAKAAGVSLGTILSISDSGGEAPRPVMYRMAAMAAPPAPPPPISAGEQTISADVAMVWEIH
jgi:uncharacterized protein